MYLKVEHESKPDIVFKLSKSEFTVGSSSSCNIVIQEKALSKKHLKIVKDNDQWFVIDQGSTNGTFLDETQLIPGKRNELTLESTLRLGDKVFLTLQTEAERAVEIPEVDTSAPGAMSSAQASTSSEQDKTRIISLDDLRNAKALADQKKAQDLKLKRAQEVKRKKAERKRMAKIVIACLVLMGLGVVGNNIWRQKMKTIKKDTIIKKIQTKIKGDEEIDKDLEGFRINRKALLARNKIIDLMTSPKCLQDETKAFCEETSVYAVKDNGVILQRPSSYIFYLEMTSYMEGLKATLQEGSTLDEETKQKLVFLSFFKDQYSRVKITENSDHYLVFYFYVNQLPELRFVGAINSGSGTMMLDELKDEKFTGTDEELKALVARMDPYFTLY